jgi:hypothetical protein
MKRLIAPAALALLAALVSPPANAAITPTCIYGGGGITQATNGAVVVINSQDHVCLLSPLPVASAGTVLTSTGVGAAPQFTAPAAGPTATPFPGAVVPTPSATGQMISSTNGSTFSLLNVGTTNQCLLSNGTIPGWSSACGLLAADQTWTGINSFTNTAGTNFGTPGVNNQNLVNIAEGAGAGDPFIHLGATSDPSWACATVIPDGMDISNNDTGSWMAFSAGGDMGFCYGIHLGSYLADFSNSHGTSGQVLSSTVSGTAWVTTPVTSANTAAVLLGHAGAPAGACVSGSLYTRSDGGAGSTLYACESSVWVAATTP